MVLGQLLSCLEKNVKAISILIAYRLPQYIPSLLNKLMEKEENRSEYQIPGWGRTLIAQNNGTSYKN